MEQGVSMKKIDNQIQQFCSTDSRRPLMCEPWIDDENVIATDAHLLLVAPRGYINESYSKCEGKHPAYKKVIPPHEKKQIISISSKYLLDECLILPSEDVYEECELCEGVGQLETKKTYKTIDCPECDGTGEDDFIGNLIPIPYEMEDQEEPCYLVKIQNTYFDPNLLLKVSRLAVYLETDIQFVLINQSAACVAYLNEIMVLIMPIVKLGRTEKWEEQENVIIIECFNQK